MNLAVGGSATHAGEPREPRAANAARPEPAQPPAREATARFKPYVIR